MRLTDLDPHFVRYETRDGVEYTITQDITFEQAQGIWFDCPVCFVKNGGPIGTHGVDVSFAGRGVLDNQGSHDSSGKPSRWTVSGSTFDDLTTQPSIFLNTSPCQWHGFITNGEVTG